MKGKSILKHKQGGAYDKHIQAEHSQVRAIEGSGKHSPYTLTIEDHTKSSYGVTKRMEIFFPKSSRFEMLL